MGKRGDRSSGSGTCAQDYTELIPGRVGEEKAKVDVRVTLPELAPVVKCVPVTSIVVDEQQLRHDPNDDDIIELAADIHAKGLLQPIGVAPLPDGRYQLLWGGRRLAAHVRLRARTIVARLYADREHSVKVIALTENLQRRELTLSEECDAVAHLHVVEGKSPDQISSLLSKSRAWVLRRLAIPGLPGDLRTVVLDGAVAIGAAEEIARLEDGGARAYLIQQVRVGGLSIADVRTLVDVYEKTPSVADAVDAGVAVASGGVEPVVVYLECARCGAKRLVTELVMVRVCQGGCSAAADVRGGDGDGNGG